MWVPPSGDLTLFFRRRCHYHLESDDKGGWPTFSVSTIANSEEGLSSRTYIPKLKARVIRLTEVRRFAIYIKAESFKIWRRGRRSERVLLSITIRKEASRFVDDYRRKCRRCSGSGSDDGCLRSGSIGECADRNSRFSIAMRNLIDTPRSGGVLRRGHQGPACRLSGDIPPC